MLEPWSYSIGAPVSQAIFKSSPEDFEVHEFFDYEFSGEGEHQLLHIEKKGRTTEEVVKDLSRLLNIPIKLISYAGLKDRQSLSTQWFSIHMPGRYIDDFEPINGLGWHIINHTRHHKKLRQGYLAGNHFVIRLKDVTSTKAVEERFWQLMNQGVPNYFGEQRFGRDGQNIEAAEAFLIQGKKVKDRFLKGIYCSTARSLIFNRILSKRIDANNWRTGVDGDVMQLAGTNSIFVADSIDSIIEQRILERDIAPASPLYGLGNMLAKDEAHQIIAQVLEAMQPWCMGLERQNLAMDWRKHVLYPANPELKINQQQAELRFSLPAGSYATAILRELINYK